MDTNASDKQLVRRLNREGEACYESGDVLGALATFERALALDGADPETLNNLAVCHLHLGDPARALQYVTAGLEVQPGHRELVTNARSILGQLGYHEDAAELAEPADFESTPPFKEPDAATDANDRDDDAAPQSRRGADLGSLEPLKSDALISVVIAIQKCSPFLKHALESVLHQEYENWEAIVVHSGAADVCDTVAGVGAAGCIHCLKHETAANAAALRNRALQNARGDVVCYLRQEDIYLRNHLNVVAQALRNNNLAFVYTAARVVNEAVVAGRREAIFEEPGRTPRTFSREALLLRNCIPITSWAHRRDCVEPFGGFDESLPAFEDWDLLLRLSTRIEPVHVPEVSVEIHQRADAVDIEHYPPADVESSALYEKIYRRHPACDSGVRRARADLLARARRRECLKNARAGDTDHRQLYEIWIEKNALSESDGQVFAERMMTRWSSRPKIELFAVAGGDDSDSLTRTLATLTRQLHRSWRLTVVCADPGILRVGVSDGRLRWLRDRGDAVAAINRAVSRSKNHWIGLIDPGDTLPPHALFACADYVNLHPQWRLLYTDEDEADHEHRRCNPKFKPELNPDLLRSMPYTGRFGLVRADAWRSLGGLRAVNGLEMHDLALRVLDRFGETSIGHISDVLFHRAQAHIEIQNAAQAFEFGREVLMEHFDRNGVRANVQQGYLDGTYFVQYEHDGLDPEISVIVPARNRLDMLRPCINSLLEKTAYPNFELIIVDNGSDDPAVLEFLADLEPHPRVRILAYPHAFNLSAMINVAARAATGSFLLLLDDNTRVIQENWLQRMLDHGRREEVGIVGCRLVSADKKLQHAGVVTGMGGVAREVFAGLDMTAPGYMGRAQTTQNCSAVTAACLLIRKSTFFQVGGMDETRLAVRYNDIDLCLKVSTLGYRIVWTPYATLMHCGSTRICENAGGDDSAQTREEAHTMYTRWLPQLARDPAYNRHLSLQASDCRPEVQVDVHWDPNFHDRPRVLAFPFHQWGSGEYRVRAPMRALGDTGRLQYAFMPLNNELRVPSVCELERAQPDVLLLHNTLHDQHLQALSLYEQYNAVFRVFGEDDLIYALPPKNPYSKTLYPDIKERIREALSHCHRLIVSTDPLVEAFADMIADIVVVPNYLERARWGALRSRRRRGAKPRVGWAGAQQHQGDLELLIDVVRATHREADWVFMGMCPEEIRSLCAEVHPGVTIQHYPKKLASLDLDLAVAPLELNAFNEAKSNLRLLEFGFLGWPVVSSDILPYRDAPVCRVVNTSAAWIEAVQERIHDLDAAHKEGDVLRRWVIRDWMLEDHLDQWVRALLPDAVIAKYFSEMNGFPGKPARAKAVG